MVITSNSTPNRVLIMEKVKNSLLKEDAKRKEKC